MMEHEIFAIAKGTLGVVKDQQVQIASLWRSHQSTLAILRKIAGLPDEEPTVAEPEIDAEAIAKMESGLAELERMFRQEEDDEKEE